MLIEQEGPPAETRRITLVAVVQPFNRIRHPVKLQLRHHCFSIGVILMEATNGMERSSSP